MRSIRFVLSLLFALVLFALVTLAMPSPSFAQFGVLVSIPPAVPARIRAASYSRPRLSLDAGLLGVEPRVWRILLGARHMGAAAPGWGSMDSGLLGLGRQRVQLESRVLGSACRVLRRCQLWIRIHW